MINLKNVLFLLCFTFSISNIVAKTTSDSISHSYLKADSLFNIEEHEIALEQFKYLANIYSQNHDYQSLVLCNLKIGIILKNESNYSKALSKLLESEMLYLSHINNDNNLYADITHEFGSIYLSLRKVDKSLKYLSKSQNLRTIDKKADSIKTATTYNNLGIAYYVSGDYNNALSYYNKALELIGNDSSSTLIPKLYQNKGLVYFKLKDYDKAKKNLNKSYQIFHSVLDKNDPTFINIYQNLGMLYKNLGMLDKALTLYKKAEIIIEKEPKNTKTHLMLYSNIGNVYRMEGDYEKAIKYYKNALSSINDKSDLSLYQKSRILNNLGNNYLDLKDYHNALKYLQQSITIKENLTLHTQKYSSYCNIGICYDKIGKLKKAEEFYLKAITNILSQSKTDYSALVQCYNYYSEFNVKNNNKQAAYKLLKKALKISKEYFGEKNPLTADCYFGFGNYYNSLGNYKNSLMYFQKAIISSIQEFNDTNIFINPKIKQISFSNYKSISLINSKANALKLLYYSNPSNIVFLKKALNTYELSISFIEMIRIKYQTRMSKLVLSKNQDKTYSAAISLSIDLFKKTSDIQYFNTAFELSEKKKAAILFSSIRINKARKFANIPQDILEKERKIKEELGFYSRKIYDEKSKNQIDRNLIKKWEKKVFYLQKEQNKLVNYLEDKFPQYYSLKYRSDVLSITEIQSKLKDNEVLIEYSLLEDEVLVIGVFKNYVKFFTTIKDSNFLQNISNLRTSTINQNVVSNVKESFRIYSTSAFYLYLKLLKPFEKYISDKKLLIIPEGNISYIPFDILLTKKPDKSDYRKLPYLIRKNIISYSYSPSLHFYISENQKNKVFSNKLIAFAPNYDLSKESLKSNEISFRNRSMNLTPLKGTKEEVKIISKIFKSNIFMDLEASEKTFKNEAPNYSIIHLAMHAIIDNNNPMFSKLIFTQTKDSTNDNLLHSFEIYNLKLKANLTVLSACKTGDGKLQKGEGVMSLARAFIFAGCPSIVMTQWEISDKSGSTLMATFYKYLRKKMPKDEALQKAKLQYLTNADKLEAHPYFWSGYILIGDTSAINIKKNTTNIYLLSALAILIALSFFIFIKKYRH